jgi:hypothetical protein
VAKGTGRESPEPTMGHLISDGGLRIGIGLATPVAAIPNIAGGELTRRLAEASRLFEDSPRLVCAFLALHPAPEGQTEVAGRVQGLAGIVAPIIGAKFGPKLLLPKG